MKQRMIFEGLSVSRFVFHGSGFCVAATKINMRTAWQKCQPDWLFRHEKFSAFLCARQAIYLLSYLLPFVEYLFSIHILQSLTENGEEKKYDVYAVCWVIVDSATSRKSLTENDKCALILLLIIFTLDVISLWTEICLKCDAPNIPFCLICLK